MNYEINYRIIGSLEEILKIMTVTLNIGAGNFKRMNENNDVTLSNHLNSVTLYLVIFVSSKSSTEFSASIALPKHYSGDTKTSQNNKSTARRRF